MTTSPYDCIVCGTHLPVTRKPWRAIEHAVGMSFVCEEHPAADVRDAVLSVECPEILDGGDPATLDAAGPPLAERVEVPGDGADAAPVVVERRDGEFGREVVVGGLERSWSRAVFGPESGPEKLRDLAAVLEGTAAWLQAGGESR